MRLWTLLAVLCGAIAAAPLAEAWPAHGVAASIPASVNTPVVGTDLTAVWNLQYAGTGPRSGYTNGVWPGTAPGTGGTTAGLPAYLISAGFVWSNIAGRLYLNVGVSSATVSNYDFTGIDGIDVDGTGSATFTDDNMPSIQGPAGINANLWDGSGVGSPLTVTVSYSRFGPAALFTVGCGTWLLSYDRFTGQAQFLGNTYFNGTGAYHLTLDHNYITGGGLAPGNNAHVELAQAISTNANSTFAVTNTLINFNEGQASVPSWGVTGGWTAVWSIGAAGGSAFSNNITLGIAAINANPINPNMLPQWISYGVPGAPLLTNNVMQAGFRLYTKNESGGGVVPSDGGGNRDLTTNTAVTPATSGWN